MSRTSLKPSQNLSKDKNTFESRLTESSSMKAFSKVSYTNSGVPSSSSSLANISINFMKDSAFPKLFNNSPMLFSFNAQPQTAKNSLRSSQLLSGFSSGARTPSASSLRSSNSYFDKDKDNIKRGSLFAKKPKDLVIDISKKTHI
jgi:outer membrane protein OmpA-like peptidoglycan-associated protein